MSVLERSTASQLSGLITNKSVFETVVAVFLVTRQTVSVLSWKRVNHHKACSVLTKTQSRIPDKLFSMSFSQIIKCSFLDLNFQRFTNESSFQCLIFTKKFLTEAFSISVLDFSLSR